MKILHIINTLETGGAQTLLFDLITHWNNTNDSHSVISLMSKNQSSTKVEKSGIPVTYFDIVPGKFESRKFSKLVKFIRSREPDVVQTWLYHSDLIGGIAAKLTGNVPVVWGVHHTTPNLAAVKKSTRTVIRILSILSRMIPDKIICCSNSAYETHVRLGYAKGKTITIYNGVDTELFKPDQNARVSLRGELGLTGKTKLIGMFARFHPQKGHFTFFQAAAILLKSNPNVHFVLAGEGVEFTNPSLKNVINRLGIQDNLHLLGNRQDMPRLHAGMDIDSLTSSYGEALPMTLCEGMSCGTPCVSTNVGDIEKVIGTAGIVVEAGNPQALADAWQTVLNLPEVEYRKLSLEARNRIKEFYSLDRTINEYKCVYDKVSSSK